VKGHHRRLGLEPAVIITDGLWLEPEVNVGLHRRFKATVHINFLFFKSFFYIFFNLEHAREHSIFF
jgi:hypothetical protein